MSGNGFFVENERGLQFFAGRGDKPGHVLVDSLSIGGNFPSKQAIMLGGSRVIDGRYDISYDGTKLRKNILQFASDASRGEDLAIDAGGRSYLISEGEMKGASESKKTSSKAKARSPPNLCASKTCKTQLANIDAGQRILENNPNLRDEMEEGILLTDETMPVDSLLHAMSAESLNKISASHIASLNENPNQPFTSICGMDPNGQRNCGAMQTNIVTYEDMRRKYGQEFAQKFGKELPEYSQIGDLTPKESAGVMAYTWKMKSEMMEDKYAPGNDNALSPAATAYIDALGYNGKESLSKTAYLKLNAALKKGKGCITLSDVAFRSNSYAYAVAGKIKQSYGDSC